MWLRQKFVIFRGKRKRLRFDFHFIVKECFKLCLCNNNLNFTYLFYVWTFKITTCLFSWSRFELTLNFQNLSVLNQIFFKVAIPLEWILSWLLFMTHIGSAVTCCSTVWAISLWLKLIKVYFGVQTISFTGQYTFWVCVCEKIRVGVQGQNRECQFGHFWEGQIQIRI